MGRWVPITAVVTTALYTVVSNALFTTLTIAFMAVGGQPDLRSILALSLAALAVTLVAAVLIVPAPSRRIVAFHARRETAVAPRHCDPDAAGRPRPRAPSAV